jgi:hypothetical protein
VTHLAALAAFLGFLALGCRVRWSPPRARRRRVQALLAYVLAIHALAAAAGWDGWPFSSHTIAVGRVRGEARLCTTEIVGVDRAGGEWPLDPYTFMPLYATVVQYWWDADGAQRPLWAQHQALAFLGARAEEARRRQAGGEPIGPQRWLGPLGAPYWLLLPRAQAASPQPYQGLHIYRACGGGRELVASWRSP